MISLTITMTAPAAPDYFAVAEELSGILNKFDDWNDPLSIDLSDWITETLQTVVEHRRDPVDVIKRTAQERIAILTNEILIDPLDKTPLQDPVIEREWTLNRLMYEDLRRLFPVSPLDEQPMSPEEPLTHDFAAAMIHWKHKLTTSPAVPVVDSVSGNREQRQVALVNASSQPEGFRRFVYQRLASAAVVTRQNRQLRAQMDDTVALVDQFMNQIEKQDQLAIGQAVAKAAEHEAALQNQLDSINETHRGTITELNGRIASMDERHRCNIAALERQLDSADQANTATVEELTRQIAAMNLEHQNALSGLEHQIEVSNQEHQQTAAHLEDQLTSTTKAHQEAMSAMNSTHSKTVSGLQTQITENVTLLNQAHARLVKADTRNLQNERDIQELHRAHAEAQQIIRRLKQEAEDADGGCGGGCIIS